MTDRHRTSCAIPPYHHANLTLRLECLPKTAQLVGQLISFGLLALLTFFLSIFFSTLQFIGALVIKWNAATAWTVRKKDGRLVCNRQIARNLSWWAASRFIFLSLRILLQIVSDLVIVWGRNGSKLGPSVLLMSQSSLVLTEQKGRQKWTDCQHVLKMEWCFRLMLVRFNKTRRQIRDFFD